MASEDRFVKLKRELSSAKSHNMSPGSLKSSRFLEFGEFRVRLAGKLGGYHVDLAP